jgi:SAM-dependent methyltransferase
LIQKRAESLLKEALKETSLKSIETDVFTPAIGALSPHQLAELFVLTSFFRSILQPLIDQDWLRSKSASMTPSAASTQVNDELRALDFLRTEIATASPKEMKHFASRASELLQIIVSLVRIENTPRFHEFAKKTMSLIDERARHQDTFPHSQLSEAMYRAFDQLDEILGIRYELDRDMPSDPKQKERLYEGAGIGVQTSYSSILLALDRAKPAQGARILDLGSGYGRVGFVLGLLRPDVDFIGYEYVEHRVEDSQAVANRAGLPRTKFVTQDLARHDFKIPEADVYYLYDPFSRETYGSVLNQLIEIGERVPITIITKGRANSWVREALENRGWSIDETCDSGTVCLFRSLPKIKDFSI